MARKKRLWTPEIVRERIRTSMLLNRLQKHVDDPENHKLSVTQMKSAMFLLSRVVGQKKDAQDLNLNGNMTVVFDDPTQRPADYERKPDHLNGST